MMQGKREKFFNSVLDKTGALIVEAFDAFKDDDATKSQIILETNRFIMTMKRKLEAKKEGEKKWKTEIA